MISFFLHIGGRAIALRQESPDLVTEPSVLINRADLCAALLDSLDLAAADAAAAASASPGAGGRLRLRFGAPAAAVDLEARTVSLAAVASVGDSDGVVAAAAAAGPADEVRPLARPACLVPLFEIAFFACDSE